MEHILVIEDEQGIRKILSSILSVAGYKVSTASNGLEGYDCIKELKPDLVLCDIKMPKMNGFELLKKLNQTNNDEILPPFIYLTARVEKSDVFKGMGLGADDYIPKPFNHENLLKAIKSKLKKKKQIKSQAIFEERDRISGELHDNVQQLLVAALIGFENLEDDFSILPEYARKKIGYNVEFIRKGIAEIRKLSKELTLANNVAFSNLKLGLQNLLDELSRMSSVFFDFTYNWTDEFPGPVNMQIFRIIQESINNSLKHANATEIELTLTENQDECEFHIIDNGIGFSENKIQKGFGLKNIEHRVQKIKGKFTIKSKLGRGTHTSIILNKHELHQLQ